VLRRRAPLIAAALAVVAGALAAVLLLRGGGDDNGGSTTAAPARAEPLAYVPAGTDAVFDLDTGAPIVALGVEQLVPRASHGALTADQVGPLLGGRVTVAVQGDRLWLMAATSAPAPRPTGGAAAAARDGVVVVASNTADLNAALAAGRQPAARQARATFDRRFQGLPAKGPVRVAFNPRALLAAQAPQLAPTAWGRSLRDGAAVLTTAGSEIRAPFRITADPAGLKPADLPIATGAAAPQARGSAPIVAGVRDPAQTLAFLRAAKIVPQLDVVDRIPGFLRPDLGNLGPQGTLTTADLERFTLRTEPPDPGGWSRKLGRLDALSGLIRATGLADVRVDKRDGVYVIEEKGELLVRVGVFGRAVVISTDPGADLGRAAAAPPTPAPPGAAGALTARVRPTALRSLGLGLPGLLTDRLGDLTGWARAELDGVNGELRLPVR
jgi:hypothetical protein